LFENADEFPEGLEDVLLLNSMGSPGLMLKLLDEVIDLDMDAMATEIEQKAAEQSEAIYLCRALIKKDPWKDIAKIIAGLKQEPESIRRVVLGYAQSVLLKGNNAQAAMVLMSFRAPLYDIGKPGLTLACYESIA